MKLNEVSQKSAKWRLKYEEDEGRSGEKNPKKKMDNPLYLRRNMADFWDTLFHYHLIRLLNLLSLCDKLKIKHN